MSDKATAKFLIVNDLGLHARAATKLVQLASKYPCEVVLSHAGQNANAEDIIALCKQKLGSVKAPKSVDFVPALPRSPVGKVLKKDLRERYWQGLERKI